MTMTKTFKIAIVGCGTISTNHLNAVKALENVKVVALCDVKRERAEAAAGKFELDAAIYTDYAEMLAKEELDSVHICTPHYLHAPMTIAALEKNINVFLEKPMCISVDDITRMIEAEKKSDARVCVCFQNRFTSAVMKAKELADLDGGARSAHFSLFWQRNEKYYTESGWRGSYKTEGGGVMINQAIHSLDLLTLFLGEPESITATTANHHLNGIIEVEDSCEGLLKFKSGATANFYATTSSSGRDYTSIYVSTRNHSIEIRLPDLIVDGSFVECEKEILPTGKECYGDGHVKLIKMFYDSLLNNTSMPVTLESAQYAVRILLCAYKSNDRETII